MYNGPEIVYYILGNHSSVLPDLLITAFGVFLGSGFALFLFVLEKKYRKTEKEQHIKVQLFNTIKRFGLLLESVIKSARKQKESFETLAKDIRLYPFHYNLPIIHATNNFTRLINSDNDTLYHSFMMYSKIANKQKKYHNIFNHADFIIIYLEGINEELASNQKFLHEKLITIRDNLLSIANNLIRMKESMEINIPNYIKEEDYINISSFSEIYIKLVKKGFADFAPFEEEFLSPLVESNINYYPIESVLHDASYCIMLMKEIRLNAAQTANNLIDINEAKHFNEATLYLEQVETFISKIEDPS